MLKYLNQVQSCLPAQAKAFLGPHATGVGWVYEYALIDRTGHQDLSQLRALQDWLLKYELKTVPNVAEVASAGGMVRQYQIVLNSDRLRAYSITQGKVIDAVQEANQETGGSVLDQAYEGLGVGIQIGDRGGSLITLVLLSRISRRNCSEYFVSRSTIGYPLE